MKTEDILAELKKAKERIEFLEQELNKPKQFEFKYESKSYLIGTANVYDEICIDSTSYFKNYRYRQTEANAKADLMLQKELMRIGALAEQIDPEYKNKVTFNLDNKNYVIFYDCTKKCYTLGSNFEWRVLGAVYMPKDVAEKVCELLNNKEVEIQ